MDLNELLQCLNRRQVVLLFADESITLNMLCTVGSRYSILESSGTRWNLPTQLGLNREAAVVDTTVVDFLAATTRDGAFTSSSGSNKFEAT
jgi:hypothetical protein